MLIVTSRQTFKSEPVTLEKWKVTGDIGFRAEKMQTMNNSTKTVCPVEDLLFLFITHTIKYFYSFTINYVF